MHEMKIIKIIIVHNIEQLLLEIILNEPLF